MSKEKFAELQKVAKKHKAKLKMYVNDDGVACVEVLVAGLGFGFTTEKFLEFVAENW